MPGINDPIVQLKAIELMPTLPTFLWDMLVEDMGPVQEGEVIWDYRKGARDNMAPFVANTVGGVTLERTGFTTQRIDFPTLAPQRIVERDDIMKRSFGEAVYGGKSPEQRARELVASDLKVLKDSITLRLEWMTAELLTTGKLTLPTYTQEGELKSAQVADFGFTNKSELSVKWSDPAADIFADLDDMYDEVTEGLGNITTLIMAPDVAAAIVNNEKFMARHDVRNAYFGQLYPKYTQVEGVKYIGTTGTGLEMYSYARKYVTEEGEIKPYIPAGQIFGVAPKIFRAYFGPITMIEKDGQPFRTYVAREVPYRNSYSKSNTEVQRVYSRPVLMPYNVDGWVQRKVL